MKLFRRFEIYSANQPSVIDQPSLGTAWSSARNMTWLALPIAIAGFLTFTFPERQIFAQTTQAAEIKDSVDPEAIKALDSMGTYLRSLKSFQVKADVTNDDVLDDGEIVQYTSKVDLLTAKPNRLRVEVTSDDKQRLFFYDGKNFTVWGKLVNYYATVPAPPTIDKLIDDADKKFGIELPLVDLFKWGTDPEAIKRIKSAIDIGPSSIDGVTCEQYAFRQEGIDWQIWIQLGQFPLPRKFVIRSLSDEARPQHSDTLTWNLAPSFDDNAFVFDPPPDAKRIVLAEEKDNNTGKDK